MIQCFLRHSALSAAFLLTATAASASNGSTTPGESVAASRVLAALRSAHPNTRFDAVTGTPIAGVYQVKMGDNYAYVGGGDTRYMVFGRLFDTRNLRDLTPGGAAGGTDAQQPESTPTPLVRLRDMPLADALKEVRGNGIRRMAVFSDPQCPFCRRLDGELKTLNDVTIYHFVVPFQGDELPMAVWCAPDRLKAWRAAMDGVLAPVSAQCANPLERNRELAGRLRVRGTPTMVFEDGRRLESYAEAREIENYLSGAKP